MDALHMMLNKLPQINEDSINSLLEEEIAHSDAKIIVLDDDPTGVQTVHGISVYTDWSIDSIRSGLAEKNRVFYILTNSRSMSEKETVHIHQTIAANIVQAAKDIQCSYLIVSRSDSTLRGHYPLETDTLRKSLEKEQLHVDGEIIAPFFKEGGRFTIGNIHYVKQGNRLVPAAETEFAKDKSFGYTQSSIPLYIEEKTGGQYCAQEVTCISLETLRTMDIDTVESQLMAVNNFGKVCLNAADDCDLKVFCIALYRAIAKGKRFLFRTAASFVKILGGISNQPLLTKQDMITGPLTNGGLVIIGSHTEKTTVQLNELLKMDGVVPILFDSNQVLAGEQAFSQEINRCVCAEEKIIQSGQTAICYTCRNLLSMENDTKESALLRSVKISDGVQKLVGHLKTKPAFIVAKGGITSSDIGTKALGVKRADVLGQVLPSIPVWQIGSESRFPGIPYIIFPGNTGGEGTLRELIEILTSPHTISR